MNFCWKTKRGGFDTSFEKIILGLHYVRKVHYLQFA